MQQKPESQLYWLDICDEGIQNKQGDYRRSWGGGGVKLENYETKKYKINPVGWGGGGDKQKLVCC